MIKFEKLNFLFSIIDQLKNHLISKLIHLNQFYQKVTETGRHPTTIPIISIPYSDKVLQFKISFDGQISVCIIIGVIE